MTLAFAAFFTYKINKLQQIIAGAEAPPQPPASDGPVDYFCLCGKPGKVVDKWAVLSENFQLKSLE